MILRKVINCFWLPGRAHCESRKRINRKGAVPSALPYVREKYIIYSMNIICVHILYTGCKWLKNCAFSLRFIIECQIWYYSQLTFFTGHYFLINIRLYGFIAKLFKIFLKSQIMNLKYIKLKIEWEIYLE